MTQAERIIARFGGIRPMAAKTGVPVTTVQGWKERGVVPQARHEEIIAAAAEHGIVLSAADFDIPDAEPPAAEAPADEAAVAAAEGADIVARAAAEAASAPEPAGNRDDEDGEDEEEEPEPEAAGEEDWPDEDEEPPRRGPAEMPAPPRPATGRAIVAGALAGIVGAAAVVAAWTWLAGGTGAPDAGVEARLAATEARLGELGEARAMAAEAAREAGRLAGGLERAEAVMGELNQRLASLPTVAEATSGLDEVKTQVAALLDRLAGIEDRLAGLAASAGGDAGAEAVTALRQESATAIAAAKDELQAALTRFGDEVTAAKSAALEARKTAMELSDTVARLSASVRTAEDRVAALERAGGPGGAGGSAALALAVGQLREAVRAGRPFAAELKAVRALAGAGVDWTAPLAVLAPHAETGIADLAVLRSQFDEVAAAAVGAAEPAPSGWLERALGDAKSLFRVRRVGEDVRGTEADAIVARAEAALGRGDLRATLAEVSALTGPPAAAVADWRGRAAARVAVEDAIAALGTLAVSRLGGAKDGAQ